MKIHILRYALLPLLIPLVLTSVLGQDSFNPLRGPYMGQVAPEEPQIFLPGKISTGADEGCSLFFTGAKSFLWRTGRLGESALLLLEDRDGRWQPPQRIGIFEDNSLVWDFTINPGGDWIYFTSDREVDGRAGSNIWRLRLDSAGLGEPEPLGGEVNSSWNDSYPSLDEEGNLYFFRRNLEEHSECDLYLAEPAPGGFRNAVKLEASLNSPSLDYDPFIAADGSYLIFSSRRPGGRGEGDLYISYRLSNGWSEPIHLGSEINSPAEENRPSVTIDGQYFFFTSNRLNEPKLPPGVPPARSMPGNGSRDIYWMRADFIEELRRELP